MLPAGDLRAIRALVAGFPDLPAWTVVETRLRGEPDATDVLVGVLRDPGVPEALAPWLPASFVDAWGDARSPAAGANVLWLEWDAPLGARPPLLLPSVDETFWLRPHRPPDALHAVERLLTLRRAAGAPDAPARAAALRAFAAALPADARLVCAAWLGPRGLDVDRLFVGVRGWDALPWLADAGWPGDADAAEAWLDRIVAPWELAWLQVEIADGLGPYLAVETPQSGAAPGGANEADFLAGLVADGVAPGRVRALLDWRGARVVEGLEERRSFHVKVTLRPDREPVIKGYYGVHHTQPTGER